MSIADWVHVISQSEMFLNHSQAKMLAWPCASPRNRSVVLESWKQPHVLNTQESGLTASPVGNLRNATPQPFCMSVCACSRMSAVTILPSISSSVVSSSFEQILRTFTSISVTEGKNTEREVMPLLFSGIVYHTVVGDVIIIVDDDTWRHSMIYSMCTIFVVLIITQCTNVCAFRRLKMYLSRQRRARTRWRHPWSWAASRGEENS